MKNRPKSRKRQRDPISRKRSRAQAFRNRPSAPARKTSSKSKKVRIVIASKLPKRSFSARERSLRALNDMRHGASISQAAQGNGVTKRTIKKYVGSALIQGRRGGRIRPTKSDRFVRYLQIPGPHGPVEIKAHGSKEATEVARYKAAVNRFLGGDLKALEPWRGRKIAGVQLVTDRQALKGLAQKELLPYSLYRSLSGGGV
jgi:hypothetical protein